MALERMQATWDANVAAIAAWDLPWHKLYGAQVLATGVGGDFGNTDRVMKYTFWIVVQPSLTHEILEFAAGEIESSLGVNF